MSRMAILLVIVGELHPVRASRCPREADAVLVIDADAVLALAVADERFESVAGRHGEVVEVVSRVEHEQFLQRPPSKGWAVPRDPASTEQPFRVLVYERQNHKPSVTRNVTRRTDPPPESSCRPIWV